MSTSPTVDTANGLDVAELILAYAEFSSDPLGFVLFAFNWGHGELEGQFGPEPWQRKILIQLGEGLSIEEAILLARTSGHGIGKSALVGWIVLWAITTFEDAKGVVTANTETQLKTKTWAEVAKWFRLCEGASLLFKMTATAVFSRDPSHEKTWRIDMVPWSERNTEAFAGLHNKNRRILVVFDEGSGIPDIIWETTEGALTDQNTQIIWAVFGNPTRNTGRFRECFDTGRFAHRWQSEAIDSRSVSFTDKKQIERWVADYGEDSDFVRVRVKGVFPRADAVSFIPYQLALDASTRIPRKEDRLGHSWVIGVDVARFGDDNSVLYPRCGPDGVSQPPEVYNGLDTMQLSAKIVLMADRLGAKVVYVDEGGVGGGVVDRLRQLNVFVIGVQFGGKAEGINTGDREAYANKRAEIWGAMRMWLQHGFIPETVVGNENTLLDELAAPTYVLNVREELQLERKIDMKRRGVASPNIADALACTFALPDFYYEAPTPIIVQGVSANADNYVEDYNPYTTARMAQ